MFIADGSTTEMLWIDQLWKRCVGRVLCDQEGEFGDREWCRMQISMGRSRIEAEDRFVIWSRI